MYVRYGVDMLGRLEGQFAFCLYDSKLVSPAGRDGVEGVRGSRRLPMVDMLLP